MDDNIERTCDLMAHHKELEQEELFLTALLSKIDKQIHALQVEQLHLLNTRNQGDTNSVNFENTVTGDVEPNESEKDKEASLENGQELDLTPIKKHDLGEEWEEEEDLDENEEEGVFPDNSADFDYL